MIHLTAFFAMVLLDFVFAVYTRKVAAGKAISASLFASLIFLVNSFVVTSFVEDATTIIPSMLGALVGTYLAMKWENKKEEEK